MNAGVALTSVGAPTFLVLTGLMVGKPLGILLSGLIAVKLFGLLLPDGIRMRELWVIGCAAGIGFTVALFVTTVAFAPGPLQDAAKMGALGSCLSAGVTVLDERTGGFTCQLGALKNRRLFPVFGRGEEEDVI
jgi:NhaA family Na+:H+ antiporter